MPNQISLYDQNNQYWSIDQLKAIKTFIEKQNLLLEAKLNQLENTNFEAQDNQIAAGMDFLSRVGITKQKELLESLINQNKEILNQIKDEIINLF